MRLAREMAALHLQASALRLCSLLDVPRASYYRAAKDPGPDGTAPLVSAIEALVLSFSGYGYRRVWVQLCRDDHEVGKKTVRGLMRDHSLLCQTKRRWAKTTDSGHGLRPHPNLTKGLRLTGCDQL